MHPEAITPERKKIFDKLKNFPEFYLVGGTGLAMQLGHRISIDFDMFWKKDIPQNLLRKIRRIFEGSKIRVKVNHSEQLSVDIDGVKVDFVKYPYPLILKPIKYQGINILKIPEIAAMKAQTLGQRITYKDYIDLYFILKNKIVSIVKIINICQKKYKDEFNARLFLEQLVCIEDVEEVKIQFLKKPVGKEKMKKFFENEIRKIKL